MKDNQDASSGIIETLKTIGNMNIQDCENMDFLYTI